MFDNINDPLSVPAPSTPDLIGSTLADLRASARPLVGVLPDASPSEDVYYDLWPRMVSAARDRILTQLPARRVLGQAEVTIPIGTAGCYDITRYGFLRVDRIALVSGTTTTWLPLYDASTPYAGDYGDTGTPVAVTFDGRLLAVFPWSDTTDATLVVQGTRLPDLMYRDEDASGLPRLLNDLTSLGAALRVIDFDIEREDHFNRRLPVLKEQYERALRDVTRTLLNNRRPRGGWRTAPAVNDAIEAGNRMGAVPSEVAARAAVPQPAAPLSLRPVNVEMTPVEGESTVTFALDHPVAIGWTEPGWSLRCVSQHQGEIFSVVVAPNRLSALATLATNPDTALPFTFMAGDTVRLSYLTSGA